MAITQWQTPIDQLRKNPRTPTVIAGLLAVLLLWSLVNFISTFRTDHLTITNAKMTSAPMHISNLSNLHLFGIYASNLNTLPTTQLQLTLEGTIVVLDAPAQSRALITSPSTPTKVYVVGDALPGNATITRIAKKYVVIDDNGILQKLALPVPILQNGE